jgi:hypothetical protein
VVLARATRVTRRVASHHGGRRRLALADKLAGLEQQYSRISSLFGVPDGAMASDLWLPPSARRVRVDPPLPAPPRTESPQVASPSAFRDADRDGGDIGEHSGSISRSRPTPTSGLGPGTVVDVGEDRVYGHSYSSITERATSRCTRARQRDTNRATASGCVATGGRADRFDRTLVRLTSPLRDLMNGEPVDPLTLVQQP